MIACSVLLVFCLQASERVPISVCGIHCTVTILAWVGVATAKGDYRYRPPNFLFGAQQKAMLLACFSGALTWVGHIHQSHFVPSPCCEQALQSTAVHVHQSALQCQGPLAVRRSVEAHNIVLSFALLVRHRSIQAETWRLRLCFCTDTLVAMQALFVPTVLAGYASMVTHHVLDSSLLVQHGQSNQLPAQVSSTSKRLLAPY